MKPSTRAAPKELDSLAPSFGVNTDFQKAKEWSDSLIDSRTQKNWTPYTLAPKDYTRPFV